MNKEPTDKQIKVFWEGYGFKQRDVPSLAWYYEKDGVFLWEYYKLPPIDLNTLFKYAVPKLREKYHTQYNVVTFLFSDWARSLIYNADQDPALALFWALYKVMEVSKCNTIQTKK